MDSGKIYKIVSDKTDKIYIGSTVKTIKKRLKEHENDYINWFNSDFNKGYYCTSFEILKYGDYKIILLEEYPCSSHSELFQREGCYQLQNYYICVNSNICKKRPRFNKIDSNEFYTCYCGRTIQNKWKTRLYHIRSWIHKFVVQEIHLDMIQKNPKFELCELPITEEHDFDLKTDKII